MSKLIITVEVGGDASRLHRATEQILKLIDDAGYLVPEFITIEEDETDEQRASNHSWE